MLEKHMPVDSVSADWILLLWLQNDAWDVQVLCVLKSFVDPGFKNLWTHMTLVFGRCLELVFQAELGLNCLFSNRIQAHTRISL